MMRMAHHGSATRRKFVWEQWDVKSEMVLLEAGYRQQPRKDTGDQQYNRDSQASFQPEFAAVYEDLPRSLGGSSNEGSGKPGQSADGNAKQITLCKIPHTVDSRNHPDAASSNGDQGGEQTKKENIEQSDGRHVGVLNMKQGEK